MRAKKTYLPVGTCSDRIEFEIEDGRVRNTVFHSGCSGNLKAIGALVEGMEADRLVGTLKGIRCGHRKSSCADQLARAVEEALEAARLANPDAIC
jgi:uncharacterized protein (TIGR03905 family)